MFFLRSLTVIDLTFRSRQHIHVSKCIYELKAAVIYVLTVMKASYRSLDSVGGCRSRCGCECASCVDEEEIPTSRPRFTPTTTYKTFLLVNSTNSVTRTVSKKMRGVVIP
jgi:hypothetical protein